MEEHNMLEATVKLALLSYILDHAGRTDIMEDWQREDLLKKLTEVIRGE